MEIGFERIKKEMDEKAEEYMGVLRTSTSMVEIHRAQGALEMYRFFNELPERIEFEQELDRDEEQ